MQDEKPKVLSQVSGTFLRTVYTDSSSDWTIIELAAKGGVSIYACGEVDSHLIVGEVLTLSGEWSRYRNRGKVFAFLSFRAVAPRDPEYFTQYLSALGQIPTDAAQMVVDAFRADALIILSRSPERLEEIQGFRDNYRERLVNNWKSLRKMDHLEEAMATSGLNPELIAELGYRLPPEADAESVLADDPWLLYIYTDSSFTTVKEYVCSTGPVEVGHYIEAGIVAVCRRALNKGSNHVSTKELMTMAPRLLGVTSTLSEERFDAAIAWLEAEDLIDRKGTGLILTEVRRIHTAIQERLKALQVEPNEITDQLTSKQLRLILSGHPETQHFIPALEQLQKGLMAKIAFFHAAHVSVEDLFERVIDGMQSALHFEILKISADYDSRPKPSMESPGVLGQCLYGPPKRGPQSPFEAEVVVVFRAHLLPSKDLKAILEACADDSVVLFVGNALTESLHVAGRPLRIVLDYAPTINLDRLSGNAGDRGLKQVLDLVQGSWDPRKYEEDIDFDLKLITIDCEDSEIPANVAAVCAGELIESLGLEHDTDTQIVVPPPTDRRTNRLYQEIERCVSMTMKQGQPHTASHKAMLKSPIYRARLPLYQVGLLHKESENKAILELPERSVTLHGVEVSLAGYALLVQLAHAQHFHVPLVIVPLPSTEKLSNDQLLDALNCSSSWTFLIGSSQNVTSTNLWSDHEL